MGRLHRVELLCPSRWEGLQKDRESSSRHGSAICWLYHPEEHTLAGSASVSSSVKWDSLNLLQELLGSFGEMMNIKGLAHSGYLALLWMLLPLPGWQGVGGGTCDRMP